MQIGAITSANQVWGATTRTLSSLAANLAAVGGRPNVGAGVVLDLRPAAGSFRCIAISESSALTSVAYGVYDGVNFDSAASSQTVWSESGFGNPTQGFSAKNVTAGGVVIAYAGFDLS